MSKTVVGLFSSMQEANTVKQQLVSAGYTGSDITVVSNHDESHLPSSSSTDLVDDAQETATGAGNKISNFFHSLVGGDDEVHEHYATGVNEGGALLTAKVNDGDELKVVNLFKQHGAKQMGGGYQQDKFAGSTKAETVTGETAIPIVEEQLVVGKREVDRGGVRVYSHVVETPVEADVTLRNEQINVQRRAVNRPATAADFTTGNAGAFELHATGEEAVVGKTSRVVEEVLVGKQSSERTEAIHDTVRKTEVEVEQIASKLDPKNR